MARYEAFFYLLYDGMRGMSIETSAVLGFPYFRSLISDACVESWTVILL